MTPEILVVRCGTVPYADGLAMQAALEAARQDGEVPDVLLLLEHPPVYTRGRRSEADELRMPTEWYEMQGIEVQETDRGGKVTYHGPGQLVAYPIVSLKPYGDDVHAYVRRLEQVAIESLAAHGVEAGTIEGLTGVWTGKMPEAAKIGSIGVHVSRSVTTHGMAINVCNDLQPFSWIVPCGLEDVRVTSLSAELGAKQQLAAFADTVAERFALVNERKAVSKTPAELGLDSARLATQ